MANSQACFPITSEPGVGGVHSTLNQITKVRLADGREVAIVDWTWRPLYSSIDTLSGWTDTELRAFTYSAGDQITVSDNMTVRETADLRHTNIKVPAQMDTEEELIVYSINCEFYAGRQDTAGAEIDFDYAGGTLQEPTIFPWDLGLLHVMCIGELEVSQKEYQQASIGWFAPGFGVVSTASVGGGGAGALLGTQNSVASRDAVDTHPVPVHIGSTEQYAFILHNPSGRAISYKDDAGAAAATRVVRMRCNLHGLHKRPSG